MNVLLFVTSFLTILALLTYAKIDSFRYFSGIEAQFERYMEQIEQVYSNQIAEKWYKTTKANTSDGHGRRPPDASPRLSFAVLIDSNLRAQNQDLYDNTMIWAKSLMTVLYKDRPFFKEASQKSPHFLTEILEGLGRAVDQLPAEQKKQLKNAADLTNLKLDSNIDTSFYLMLKGCQREESKMGLVPLNQSNFVSLDGNDSDYEDDNIEEAKEYTGGKGYDSLLNYITLQKSTKVRVYLASFPVLQAISGQAAFARSIIEARTSIYQTIKNASPIPDDTSTQFQAVVQGYISGANTKFLDFTVTKTNPAQYN
ncbi:MAG: hypothetical protein H0T62_13375 [Parachlamydiaceae bacterium]|nr:hypothetical protein [Parachlamydiaceae bacterium]